MLFYLEVKLGKCAKKQQSTKEIPVRCSLYIGLSRESNAINNIG